MADRILVVEDEAEIAELLELYLGNEGYGVVKCSSGAGALRVVETEAFDLALLDLMLPDIDGLALCRTIRERHHYPIIMLTARDSESDKITGLTYGADDYVTKPFRPLELMARVRAQLRRYKRYNLPEREPAKSGLLTHAGLVMNVQNHSCTLHDRDLSLTPTEFEILRILLERKGAVVSAEELFREIWREEYYTKNNNSITVHVRHLRDKMMDTAEAPEYIRTVWGVGYKIED